MRRWKFNGSFSLYQKPGIEISWIRETSTLNPPIPRHRKADTSKGVSSILMASKVPARRKSKAICNATPRRLRSWRNKVPKTNPNQKQSSCTVGRNPANQILSSLLPMNIVSKSQLESWKPSSLFMGFWRICWHFSVVKCGWHFEGEVNKYHSLVSNRLNNTQIGSYPQVGMNVKNTWSHREANWLQFLPKMIRLLRVQEKFVGKVFCQEFPAFTAFDGKSPVNNHLECKISTG